MQLVPVMDTRNNENIAFFPSIIYKSQISVLQYLICAVIHKGELYEENIFSFNIVDNGV